MTDQPQPQPHPDTAALERLRVLLDPASGMAFTPFGPKPRLFNESDIRRALAGEQ